MDNQLSCDAQDMLEAAIVQKRRLNLKSLDDAGHVTAHPKILPININTNDGQEHLEFMTTDNKGGIIKLSINTALITAFEAKDFLDPRIMYKANNNKSCHLK